MKLPSRPFQLGYFDSTPRVISSWFMNNNFPLKPKEYLYYLRTFVVTMEKYLSLLCVLVKLPHFFRRYGDCTA